MESARRVLARADVLATHSIHGPSNIERSYLTPDHAEVNALAALWMTEAGMRSWQDPAGNQCGRRERDDADRPALLIGSHLDTVPDAGRYDGILGVLAGIEVADRLRDADLPFALEVVAFGDEEGTRFGATLLGSRALAGSWDEDWLELEDADGVTLARAAEDFGLDPAAIGSAGREPGSVVAYLEAHIEQGPRLERVGRALGVVTGIAAAQRRRIVFRGEARHAATPWELRRDALLGASEAVVEAHRIAKQQGSTSVIGRITAEPGAVNVVPGLAEFTLDLRDETAAGRDATWERIQSAFHGIAADRRLDVDVELTHAAPEVRCAPGLREAVAAGIRTTGDENPLDLFSIAGHDAMAVADLCDVGMLFVRCAGGISHHPDESVTVEDVALAIDALEAAVLELAARS